MSCYGLLGYPLGHSFSKKYFGERLDYRNFEYATVEEFIASKPSDLAGFNVTIPHKRAIIPFLDQLSEEAKAIGAVNCVKICEGKMIGYNTDCVGFERSLLKLIGDAKIEQALVLGNGGASQAVQYALHKLGLKVIVVSRSGVVNYQNLSDQQILDSKLIVNCTSLGMSPNVETFPEINYEVLTKNHYLYDLVYNPALTAFMKKGVDKGCKVVNGLEMLHLQAERGFEIWTL